MQQASRHNVQIEYNSQVTQKKYNTQLGIRMHSITYMPIV